MEIKVTDKPVPKEVLDYCRAVSEEDRSGGDVEVEQTTFELEVEAYRAFVKRYQAEPDVKIKTVMSNMLQYLLFSKQHGMRPSYALTEALEDAVNAELVARKKLYPLPLHDEIATVLTSSTDTVGRGRTTRWKMNTNVDYSQFDGADREWFDNWTAQETLNSFVRFGAHRFAVGDAAQRILEMLEKRYGLNFKELERKRKG